MSLTTPLSNTTLDGAQSVTSLKTPPSNTTLDEPIRRDELEKLCKEERVLRKRYWNQMEDTKGKIRVFARCRPVA